MDCVGYQWLKVCTFEDEMKVAREAVLPVVEHCWIDLLGSIDYVLQTNRTVDKGSECSRNTGRVDSASVAYSKDRNDLGKTEDCHSLHFEIKWLVMISALVNVSYRSSPKLSSSTISRFQKSDAVFPTDYWTSVHAIRIVFFSPVGYPYGMPAEVGVVGCAVFRSLIMIFRSISVQWQSHDLKRTEINHSDIRVTIKLSWEKRR